MGVRAIAIDDGGMTLDMQVKPDRSNCIRYFQCSEAIDRA